MRVAHVVFQRDRERRSPDELLVAWPTLTQVAAATRSDEVDVFAVVLHDENARRQQRSIDVHFTPSPHNTLRQRQPDVLHVRLVASLDARVQRLHKQENFSLAEAQDIAVKRDQASAEYLKRFYNLDWADPTLYDLVINTTKLGLEGVTQLIVAAVEHLPVAKPA